MEGFKVDLDKKEVYLVDEIPAHSTKIWSIEENSKWLDVYDTETDAERISVRGRWQKFSRQLAELGVYRDNQQCRQHVSCFPFQ